MHAVNCLETITRRTRIFCCTSAVVRFVLARSLFAVLLKRWNCPDSHTPRAAQLDRLARSKYLSKE